jgi:cyclic-di-AMP phosphodiesterase PgpH
MAPKNKAKKSGQIEESALLSSTRVIQVFTGGFTLKTYIFIGLFVVINFLFPSGKGSEVYDIPKEGEITKKAIIAPFTFDILKTKEEIDKEQREAVQKILPVAEYNYDVTEKMFGKFKSFFKQVALLKNNTVSDSVKTRIWAELKTDLSPSTVDAFVQSDLNFDNLLYIVDDILDQGICAALFVKDDKEAEAFKKRYNVDYVNLQIASDGFVAYLRDDKEKTVSARELLTKEEVLEQQKARLRKQYGKNILGPLYELLYAYTAPNIFFLQDETQKRRDQTARAILPTRGKVVKDLEIVGKNKLITPEIYRNIYSLSVAQEKMRDVKGRKDWYPLLGRALLILFILFLLFYNLDHVQQRHFARAGNVLALSLVLVIQFALAAAVLRLINELIIPMEWGGDLEWGYLLPMTMGPMLVTVLYDLESGILFTFISALLLSVMLGFELKITLTHFFAGLIAARAVTTSATARSSSWRCFFSRSPISP